MLLLAVDEPCAAVEVNVLASIPIPAIITVLSVAVVVSPWVLIKVATSSNNPETNEIELLPELAFDLGVVLPVVQLAVCSVHTPPDSTRL